MTIDIFDTTAIDRVRVLGAHLGIDIRESLRAATIDMTTDEVTQLTLSVVDPGWRILGTGLLVPGMQVDFEDFHLSIAGIDTEDADGTEGFTVKCRPLIVRALKQRVGALILRDISPTEFVSLECAAVGARLVAQSSQQRAIVARDVPTPGQLYDPLSTPSSWTTIQRLAEELGYITFESAGVVYFAKPTWLVANLPSASARYRTGDVGLWSDDVPLCSKSEDSLMTSVQMRIPSRRVGLYRPGYALDFKGVPQFDGKYIVTAMSFDLLDVGGGVQIQGETPIDPVKLQPPPSDGKRNGTYSSEDFVYWAVAQIGDRYVYGQPVEPDNPDPSVFDCSGLVSWALARVGVKGVPHQSEQQIDRFARGGGEVTVAEGIKTRGAVLWQQGHIAISLGNGKTVEAQNEQVGVISDSATGRGFARAARIPELRYNTGRQVPDGGTPPTPG